MRRWMASGAIAMLGLAVAPFLAAAPANAQASGCEQIQKLISERQSIVARLAASQKAKKKMTPQEACSTFGRLVAAYIGQGGQVADIGRPLVERWMAGVLYRLKLHAEESGAALEDYACTLIAAVIGERDSAFAQIGDGAAVLSAGTGWNHVFWPQHGEFANTTNFITSAHALDALEFGTSNQPIQEIALFTDGLENLVLQKAARAVHAPFFDSMFPAVRRSTAPGVDAELSAALGRYLSGAPVNERTDDDKTLVLASRRQA